MSGDRPGPRVLVVGSGWRFTSGISYYTCRLANALSTVTPTDVILMRRLVPRALYPGRSRVGVAVNDLEYDADIHVYDGVDWFWGRSMRDARRFVRSQQPDVVVLQWWTGAVLLSYLNLARLARRNGARVVMEWHEVQDTGEARIPGVVPYVRRAIGALLSLVDAHVVHSRYDLELLQAAYRIEETTPDGVSRVTVVPHGPYDHVNPETPAVPRVSSPDTPFNVLFFGTIRPYKGLEDLVDAFGALPAEAQERMHLTIVGETWEGWTGPLESVATSPARDRITVVNRYVTDAEAREHFAAADAVVLPYRRSSASGPLHMAMSAGLPTVVTSVGGLVDAAGDYEGVTFVPPADVPSLVEALKGLPAQRDRRYADPHTWDTTVAAYRSIVGQLDLPVWDMAANATRR
ncbi:MAG: glycosyltransferase family 4 protein [Actinomycetota bacterium]|nr:glycosyltransferase family 4 protein [Actinomycetota bacterium]